MANNVKAIRQIVSRLVGCVVIAAALWWILILALQNPDMTATRLFLTFWKEYLIIVALIIGGYLAVIQWDNSKA